MVTSLYLIRHGETASGDASRYHGSIDIPLSEKGRHQVAEKMATINKHLSTAKISKYLSYLREVHGDHTRNAKAGKGESRLSAVYCSDLKRAVQSAEIISRPYRLSPLQTNELRERNFGIWEGMSFAEIKKKHPDEFSLWAVNPLMHAPPGGETTIEVSQRVMRAVRTILDKHPGEEIVIVAHGCVNRIILCHITGIPLENLFRIEQDYAALNIIEFWEKYPVLKLLNG